ncbi:MAG TPA: hypothetical protein VF895_09155 [Gaiellaceae bacterium]
MRPDAERKIVADLAALDLNTSQIARATRIPRATIRDWLKQPEREPKLGRPVTLELDSLPKRQYSYLLGFYLGDGALSQHRRGVFKLRIITDEIYPRIVAECVAAMQAVIPRNRVSVNRLPCRAVEIGCYSKAWPLLFPQHGPGRKHTRKIELSPWQAAIVQRFPREFLRGLIHSDGCRVLNRVNGKDYPRYFFDQVSDDIRRLFCDACDQLGVSYTWSRWKTVSIARADSVALLDSFVGPKS